MRRRSLALIVLLACGLLSAPLAAAAPRTITAPSGCTNPHPHGAVPVTFGLDPRQLASAYGVLPLWQAGFKGQGHSVALIEIAARLDKPAFKSQSDCYGPYPTPHETLVGGGPQPMVGGEAIFDPAVIAAIAPRAQIFMFESSSGDTENELPILLNAALNPANTGGRHVDAISISFGFCEATVPIAEIQASQAALRHAASLGIPFFAAGDDNGSPGSFTPPGGPQCVFPPVDPSVPHPGASVGLYYPGSSPLVTAVGGTELAVNGSVPPAGVPAAGTITDEVVWNQPASPGTLFAGGGGVSSLFTVADAPWEQRVGRSGKEAKPDITALAGSPNYLNGGIGTSGGAPFMAGTIAVLDGYLHHHNVPRIGMLNPTLYRVGTDAAVAPRVFNDVIHGTNDILGLGCCNAKPGYDLTSGFGSLNVQGLGRAIVNHPGLRTPWTRITLSAHGTLPIGLPERIEADTNNTLTGTPYELDIYAAGHLIKQCAASPCVGLYTPPELPSSTFVAQAMVGPALTKPFTADAIASKSLSVTTHFKPPHCKPSGCINPPNRPRREP